MRLRLVAKYTLVTSTVLLLTMAGFAMLGMQALERLCLDEAIKDIANLSETILRTTHHQMLVDDRQRVYQAIEEVGHQQGIEHIRLINKDGVISFSTDSREIGGLVDKQAEACNMCHSNEEASPLIQVSSMNRSRRYFDQDGRDVLGMANAIYNQPNCSSFACHVHLPESRLLGVLDVSMSLDEMNHLLDRFRRNIIVFTIALLLVLSLSLMALTQRFVHRPVQKLLSHTRKLAKGELNIQIENLERDELGELEEAFNEMTCSLQTVQGELKDLASSLEVKVEERTRQIQEIQTQLMRSERLASLGELVAGIAHEINNPLTGILFFCSMVRNHPNLDPVLRNDLDTITQETQRCAVIVRRLLEFSRETLPCKSSESISRILDKTLELLEHQASFHDILVIRQYGANLPAIAVDGNQLEQVFMNIILNAAQAMPGGGELHLGTTMELDGQEVRITIRDTGCGIPEENLKRIFDPFYTTKPHGGTGLGLSVSFGIVSNHDGRIEVESRVGQGTTFHIFLPVDSSEIRLCEIEKGGLPAATSTAIGET